MFNLKQIIIKKFTSKKDLKTNKKNQGKNIFTLVFYLFY
jgi:hypothetical protein